MEMVLCYVVSDDWCRFVSSYSRIARERHA